MLRLTLRNIRCFPELVVDFGHSGRPTDWTLVLGNNASGKSTLLRALALSLAPSTDLGSMLHADGDSWAGPESGPGEIVLTLHVDGEELERTLTLTSARRSTVAFSTSGSANAYLEEKPLLLAGYGAARQLQGTKEFTVYSRFDSTSTLMSMNGALQNPELAVRRVVANADPKPLLERIDHILLLEPGSTVLSSAGLVVRGPDGVMRPLTQLSDGFRGTLSWVMDFIGWQFMAGEYFGLDEVPAIVIVDEIEQHLHPQWQRAVIARLREQFPAVQFIVSTHAPLCVIGSTDLADEDVSLVYVERGRGEDGQAWSRAQSGMLPPRDLRADQVLTSYLFGLSSTRAHGVEDSIKELSSLLSREQRSPAEQERVVALRRELEPLLGSAETEIEREVQREALAAAKRVIARELGRLSPEEREQILDIDHPVE
ncbi:MAG: AAA family ATPase [Deltaproteobacteria bacterium]|nr:AAA family ATPase [Deltaproteobacteria bacterium]